MSETAKHTPGEWKIRRSNDGSGDVGITADGLPSVLAECFGDIRHRGERAADEAMANALLMAAAPDMLAALTECQAALAMMIEPNSIERTTLPVAFAQATAAEAKARAALSRATGEGR